MYSPFDISVKKGEIKEKPKNSERGRTNKGEIAMQGEKRTKIEHIR